MSWSQPDNDLLDELPLVGGRMTQHCQATAFSPLHRMTTTRRLISIQRHIAAAFLYAYESTILTLSRLNTEFDKKTRRKRKRSYARFGRLKDGLLILAFLPLTIPGMQLRGRHLLGGLFGGFSGIFFGRFRATPSGSFKGRAR